MGFHVLYITVNVISVIVRYYIGYCFKKKREDNIDIIDVKFFSRIFMICAVVFMILLGAMNAATMHVVEKHPLGFFLCEELFVLSLVFVSLLYDRYYWALPIGGIIKQPALGKKKELKYDDIEFYTVDASNQIVLHTNDGEKLIIPVIDNGMYVRVQCLLESHRVHSQNPLDNERIILREGKARRIGSIITSSMSWVLLIAGIYYKSIWILGFAVPYVLGTLYEIISRHYNTLTIENEKIIYKRFMKKNMEISLSDIKTYCVKDINNAEMIVLMTEDNRKIKINMLWENAYLINTYIERYKWKRI